MTPEVWRSIRETATPARTKPRDTHMNSEARAQALTETAPTQVVASPRLQRKRRHSAVLATVLGAVVGVLVGALLVALLVALVFALHH